MTSMRMLMVIWTAVALAVGLSIAGCQGDSAGSESQTAKDTIPIATGDSVGSESRGGVGEAPPLQCGPQVQNPPYDVRPHGRFVAWTPDGSHILFDDGTRVMKVDVEGTELETIVDANPGHWFLLGFHADLSADGSRIVYSSCEYWIDGLDTYGTRWFPERGKYNYEIATVALDGSAPERLTEDPAIDHYPVWSPDMTHIRVPSWGILPEDTEDHAARRLSPANLGARRLASRVHPRRTSPPSGRLIVHIWRSSAMGTRQPLINTGGLITGFPGPSIPLALTVLGSAGYWNTWGRRTGHRTAGGSPWPGWRARTSFSRLSLQTGRTLAGSSR